MSAAGPQHVTAVFAQYGDMHSARATVTLPHVMGLDRRAVRQRFEERLTATRMADDYVRVYDLLLARTNVKLSRAKPSLCLRPPQSLPTSRVSRIH
jgi:hypothetical protein